MRTDKAFYFSVGLNEIPWDRLVHWYGRATDFPNYFNDILSDDPERQKEALDTIGGAIEHQDGIIMATPFSLIFLFRLLSFDKTDKKRILDIILIVADSAKYQFESYENQEAPTTIGNLQELLKEQYIWPVFESESQDEVNWEGYGYDNEHYYWLKYIFDIIKAFSFLLTKFADEAEMAIANQILAAAD